MPDAHILLHMHVHIHTHIHIHAHIHIQILVRIHTYTYVSAHMYTSYCSGICAVSPDEAVFRPRLNPDLYKDAKAQALLLEIPGCQMYYPGCKPTLPQQVGTKISAENQPLGGCLPWALLRHCHGGPGSFQAAILPIGSYRTLPGYASVSPH